MHLLTHKCSVDTVPSGKSYVSSFIEWVNRMMFHSTFVSDVDVGKETSYSMTTHTGLFHLG